MATRVWAVRASDEEVARWKAVAEPNLNRWIRMSLNDAAAWAEAQKFEEEAARLERESRRRAAFGE